MLFNSIDFVVFLPIVFTLYWWIGSNRRHGQNLLIVAASYVFYGWWDWRFLSLILFSTLVDYLVGRGLAKEDRPTRRKVLLWTSITVNLGLLGFFKYYNFFVANFVEAFTFFGASIEPYTLQIILPVGISFYTFQTLSYTIDVYKRKIQPTPLEQASLSETGKDLIAFAAFVSFFPQLVAGPIERAKNLLPQFQQNRLFDYAKAVDGMRQILWGVFKKVVIADSCGEYVDLIFQNPGDYGGSTLLLGAFFFAFQIYGDFSGYSDIAIGTARLFGIDLMKNFAFPYFSRDIAEFWRRWHISLSTWFRDYLYIPLGGSRGGQWLKIRNTFIIFVVSGCWHGANWTFVVWGALNAIYFLPLQLTGNNRKNMDIVARKRSLPSAREILSILITFGLTLVAWVFFRAEDLSQAFVYMGGMFSGSLLSIPDLPDMGKVVVTGLLIVFFTGMEWLGREGAFALEQVYRIRTRWFRWALYGWLIFLIGMFMETDETPFIYFQF